MNIAIYCELFISKSMTFIINPIVYSLKKHNVVVLTNWIANQNIFPKVKVVRIPNTSC